MKINGYGLYHTQQISHSIILARMLMGDILELISAIQVYLEKRLWHQNPALSLQYILDVRMLVENPRAYLVLLKRGVVVTIQV